MSRERYRSPFRKRRVPMRTLGDARRRLRRIIRDGATCPLCEQRTKVYKRKMHSSMAVALIRVARFFRRKRDPWLHLPSFFASLRLPKRLKATLYGDVPKLVEWGLLQAQVDRRADGSSRVGNYRITERGKRFVAGKLRLPKYVYFYNDRALGFAGPRVRIDDVLGDRFDYAELMAS